MRLIVINRLTALTKIAGEKMWTETRPSLIKQQRLWPNFTRDKNAKCKSLELKTWLAT